MSYCLPAYAVSSQLPFLSSESYHSLPFFVRRLAYAFMVAQNSHSYNEIPSRWLIQFDIVSLSPAAFLFFLCPHRKYQLSCNNLQHFLIPAVHVYMIGQPLFNIYLCIIDLPHHSFEHSILFFILWRQYNSFMYGTG